MSFRRIFLALILCLILFLSFLFLTLPESPVPADKATGHADSCRPCRVDQLIFQHSPQHSLSQSQHQPPRTNHHALSPTSSSPATLSIPSPAPTAFLGLTSPTTTNRKPQPLKYRSGNKNQFQSRRLPEHRPLLHQPDI